MRVATSTESVRRTAFLVATILLIGAAGPAWAAVNQVRGGIGGVNNGTLLGGDGSGEAQLSVSNTTLALVKQARDLAGTVLPNGTDVSQGQTVFFVLYVDNTTGFPAVDVRITDLLDEARFTYVAASLEQASVATGADDATIWAGPWTALTDAVGAPDDDASATDTGGPAGLDRVTVGGVTGQVNATVDVPASTLKAFRFRVTVN